MKTILLDIGNVLFDVDFNKFCQAFSIGGRLTEDELFSRFCSGRLKDQLDKGLLTPYHFFEKMSLELGNENLNMDSFYELWNGIFSIKRESIAAIDYLKYRSDIWIMSDTDPIHFSYFLNSFPLFKNCDKYVLSYVTGYLKREKEAFIWIKDHYNRTLDECILIDDKAENCRTAESCGAKSILFHDWDSTLEILNRQCFGYADAAW